MCGRYVLFTAMEQLVDCVAQALPLSLPAGQRPQVVRTEPLRANYNVAPTNIVPVVRMFKGVPTIGPAQWGYPPKTVFNARGETVWEKQLFAGSVPCAFVMDGWYEWVDKQPWFTQQDSGPLLVAGLCKVVDGALFGTIVTVDAVPELQWLHHRMPRLLVGDGEVEAWLGGGQRMREMSSSIDAQVVASAGLHSQKAAKEVGSVRNNHSGLIHSGLIGE